MIFDYFFYFLNIFFIFLIPKADFGGFSPKCLLLLKVYLKSATFSSRQGRDPQPGRHQKSRFFPSWLCYGRYFAAHAYKGVFFPSRLCYGRYFAAHAYKGVFSLRDFVTKGHISYSSSKTDQQSRDGFGTRPNLPPPSLRDPVLARNKS